MPDRTYIESAVSRLGHAVRNANSALSTDFCPSANRYVYWLKEPRWLLLLAILGSALCAIMVNPLVLVLTAILVVLAVVGIGVPWLAVRGIDCVVTFDMPRGRVGQPAIVRLKVTNHWPISVWGLSLIRGFAQDDSPDGNEGVALARVPGRSTVEFSWGFTPLCRGNYPCAPAEVETSFPFGLFRGRRTAKVDGHLVVWPRTARLEGSPDYSETSDAEDEFCDRRVGNDGDMTGTRQFRRGDSLRRIHWGQTARRQSLIVTERQAPATSTVRIVADISSESHPAATAGVTLERCIEAAASLCESLHRQNSRVELHLGDQWIVAGKSPHGFHNAIDALAVAELSSGSTRGASRRPGFEILVTTSHGYQSDHQRQLVIDATDSMTGAWIKVSEDADLLAQLTQSWQKVCRNA